MRYDVVIVGGGAAGSVLASRLAENENTSILVLEAGPDYPDPHNIPDEIKYGGTRYAEAQDSKHNWALRGTITEEQGEIHVAQGHVIGGGSSINGQAMQRGLPEDFEAWAALGNDEWSYTKVLPFFRKSEHDLDIRDDFHGTDGPMPVRRRQSGPIPDIQRAFREALLQDGYNTVADTNGSNPAGIGVAPSNNLDGMRMSAAMTFLAPVRHRLNLTVRGGVAVRKILIEDQKAVGVEAESGGEVFNIEAERVVLCSGAIRSPQLLMLSGIGPHEELGKSNIAQVVDAPGVGQNLRDHPSVAITWRTKEGFPLDGMAPRMQVTLRYTATGSDLRNDIKVSMQSFATERVDRGGDRMKPLGIRITAGLQLALGAGHIGLNSADPYQQPDLNYNYLQEEWDRERMREMVRICVGFEDHPDMRDIVQERIAPTDADLEDDLALDRWMLREVTTQHHISGTCKMGPDSDPMAVVDQYARLKGIENMRVVDASIMPDCIRANTNVTTMMIAERIADFIKNGN